MLSYETLDAIADSVNPAIFLVTLAMAWLPRLRPVLHPVRWVGVIVSALGCVYGLKYLDAQLNIWPTWGLDYSTHSAFAVGLISLWAFASMRWLIVGTLVFVGYASLMIYQRYHTGFDILLTAIVVIPITLAVAAAIRPRRLAKTY